MMDTGELVYTGIYTVKYMYLTHYRALDTVQRARGRPQVGVLICQRLASVWGFGLSLARGRQPSSEPSQAYLSLLPGSDWL